MIYFLIGIAGMLGAILRYLIGLSFYTHAVFPFATLCVNLIGSFLLAWLSTSVFQKFSISPAFKTAIGTGFVSSFTTFSTVSVETVELFVDGRVLSGILYIFVSIVGGMFMCRLGFKASSKKVQES